MVADATAVFLLQRRVLAEGRWFLNSLEEAHQTVEKKIKLLREIQRGDNSLFFVATRGPALLGWVHVAGEPHPLARHVGRLEIMVDPDARGQGVGDALMAATITAAEAHPVLQKLSLAVFADNTVAIGLYHKHGFFEEGRREREYRTPEGAWRADVLLARWVEHTQRGS